MICGNVTTMFGGQTCTRDPHHLGEHQTLPIDGRISQWSAEGGGGSQWAVEDTRHPDWRIVACSHCGVRFQPDAYRNTKGGTACFHCLFWTERMAQYVNGEIMVIEGTVYSWGPAHGYGGREFSIIADGITITKRGLWCGGDVPPEYRDVLRDNAYWSPDSPKP
jgi:hypothetical protein